MDLIKKLREIKDLKVSFGKADEYFPVFCERIDSCSMNRPGFGLGIPDSLSMENKLRGVFRTINSEKGIFIFNINGVDILRAKQGFQDFNEADSNSMITEWELSTILSEEDYLNNTIFHNGKVEFTKNEKGLELLWN